MHAAVFKGPGKKLELEQRPVPKIQHPDDVILEVGGVGICGSDLGILEGPHVHPAKPGVILGHEFCGTVVEVGPEVKSLRVKQRVAVDPNPGCGRCYMCRNGFPNNCIPLFDNKEAPEKGWPYTPGQWWDGGLANYVMVPAHYCYEISDRVPLKHVAIFEPIGVAANAMSKVKPQPGEVAVVIGGGPVGLLSASLLKAAGCSLLVAAETKERRRQLLKDCGADVVVDPAQEDLVEVVMKHTKEIGAQVAVEAVGTLLPLALGVLSFGGRIAQVGIPHSDITFRPFHVFSKEAQIFGVFLMKHAMNNAIRLLETESLPLDTIITHTFPLEKVNEGIDIARRGEGGKVVILPNEI
jgi:threonine dehydrogenase-like Zn-dependent dehydrogenase